jgi:hypothetical protein
MMKKKQLVVRHLEDVSWRVLDQYPRVVKDMIRGQFGIYALYRGKNLYYVGLASNLMGRLKTHLKDRHRGLWDRFSVYLTVRQDHMKELESLILRIVNPRGNKTAGKFAASENLRSTLNRQMRQADADRRALLMGGRVARGRRRKKAGEGKGTLRLAGVIDRRITLKAYHKGYEYRASLRKDGKTSYGSRLYDSPSAAAKAVIRRACNGWAFWHYRNEKGEWVPLRELRG